MILTNAIAVDIDMQEDFIPLLMGKYGVEE